MYKNNYLKLLILFLILTACNNNNAKNSNISSNLITNCDSSSSEESTTYHKPSIKLSILTYDELLLPIEDRLKIIINNKFSKIDKLLFSEYYGRKPCYSVIDAMKKWNINYEEIEEAKEELFNINMIIVNNDFDGFTNRIAEKIIFDLTGDTTTIDSIELTNKYRERIMLYIYFFPNIKLYTNSDENSYGTYYVGLSNILMGEDEQDSYRIGILPMLSDLMEEEYIDYQEIPSKYVYSSYIFNYNKNLFAGFAICKVNGEWKIVIIY